MSEIDIAFENILSVIFYIECYNYAVDSGKCTKRIVLNALHDLTEFVEGINNEN